MNIEIDGNCIGSERDFHLLIASALHLPSHYGKNLSALWDVLGTDVERPLRLVWKHASVSEARLGDDFDRIVGVLRRVEAQDASLGLAQTFELRLC